MNRKLAFVLAAADTGTLIVNRLDYDTNHQGLGGGACILENGDCELREIVAAGQILQALSEHRKAHLMVVDGGANIGYITVAWANLIRGWGSILAIEPQERVFYALCGNIAINNCSNASAIRAVLGAEPGEMEIPVWDPEMPHNSGGCHMDIACDPGAQPVSRVTVPKVTIDTLNLPRLDFLKLDIEGMEPKALLGARETIRRFKPVLQIEWHVCGKQVLEEMLGENYDFIPAGINVVCVPKGDPGQGAISMRRTGFYFHQTDEDPQRSKGQQRVKESDGFICSHCGKGVFVPPFADPADVGGFCRVHGGDNYLESLICQACVQKGGCVVFEEQLRRVEARQMLFTDIGKL